jgi:exopolysaccharide biosynthesis polyprenyl glycosylphosphotransferase
MIGFYLRFIDAAAVGATSAAVWWITQAAGWPMGERPAFVTFSAVSVLALLALGARLRVYHARRTERLGKELASLFEICLYASGLACVLTQVLGAGLPASTYITLFIADTGALLSIRVVMRTTIRLMRSQGRDYRIWLLIGHNARAARIAKEVLANPHYGVRIDEIVDFGEQRGGGHADARLRAMGRLLSTIPSRTVQGAEEVRHILASRIIDEVVITLPVRSYYDEMKSILDLCHEAGISVKLQPDPFDRVGYKSEVSQIGDIPIVTHYTGPSHVHLATKRMVDLIGATVGLLLLSPLLVVIALAIKLTSAGPAFFRQTRVGLYGRHFEIIKFRSMRADAQQHREELAALNEAQDVAFKIRHDPRVTAVGRVLRNFHLDELPQLWNVLVGDMSLVGPRPLVPNEAHGNEWWQRRRLSMPPGLTCFWQVTGDHRMPFRNWVQLDLDYIDGWSVWLDLKLIFSTFTTMARGDGW